MACIGQRTADSGPSRAQTDHTADVNGYSGETAGRGGDRKVGASPYTTDTTRQALHVCVAGSGSLNARHCRHIVLHALRCAQSQCLRTLTRDS